MGIPNLTGRASAVGKLRELAGCGCPRQRDAPRAHRQSALAPVSAGLAIVFVGCLGRYITKIRCREFEAELNGLQRKVKLRWDPAHTGSSRQDRQGCDYTAYVPDPLHHRQLRLDAAIAADVTDAELAIARVSPLADSEALARLLVSAEAVASSRIEGVAIGARGLLKAELAQTSRAGVPTLRRPRF